MTSRYERRLAARGAAAKNEKAMGVGLMDGAKTGPGGGKRFRESHGAHNTRSTRVFDLTLVCLAAHESQAAKRTVRGHGACATESTALCTLARARALVDQAAPREDAAAGVVYQWVAVGNRNAASQWRVRRHEGAHAGLQRRWRTWFFCVCLLCAAQAHCECIC